ncbi:hypothetical protein BJY00DRAFT_102800 [Aspergillus carlsbadensis]|nr:hypothetical protein BJY00DRAFT_102800 [Aspergillus carlsbadensis]
MALLGYFLHLLYPSADPISPSSAFFFFFPFFSLHFINATLLGTYTITCINPNREHYSSISSLYWSRVVSNK